METISLKVGDVIRWNKARKHQEIIHQFEYGGKTYFIVKDTDKNYGFEIHTKEMMENIHIFYGNVYDGVVEVNGYQVRGLGGKVLGTPKMVEKKEKVVETPVKKENKPLTDFQKFYRLQMSGKINMNDIVTGSMLTGLSEEKYTDIMWHYSEYKAGTRK